MEFGCPLKFGGGTKCQRRCAAEIAAGRKYPLCRRTETDCSFSRYAKLHSQQQVYQEADPLYSDDRAHTHTQLTAQHSCLLDLFKHF